MSTPIEPAAPAKAGAFAREGQADVAVLVVTYNNASDIDQLLATLRLEANDLPLRVVIADNQSSDDTLSRARRHPDVISVATGGNLGYGGGVNVAAAHAGQARALLVLNPDLRVRRGAVAALLSALDASPDAGVVAPRIVDSEGETAVSLFHEPSLVRAAADALLGRVWSSRPRMLSEWNRTTGAYDRPHHTDWASGAALMISAHAAEAVGEWDERFFLYSEETDYCRRLRDRGFSVRYEPRAVVEHDQGGSGSSPQLDALRGVSRVRYMRKHAPQKAGAYRWIAVVAAAVRSRTSEPHRLTARMLRDERLWPTLPHATWTGEPGALAASIVIPAHDEQAVIMRTLRALHDPLDSGSVEIHVVCNGCRDSTAELAHQISGVHVAELTESSKIVALNSGDSVATVFPRIYLDADIEMPAAALPALVRSLSRPGVLAARPRFEYDTTRSSAVVRSYYRARMRIPSMSNSLWGAGVYAVNHAGHGLIAPFPRVIADDVYVDEVIPDAAKAFPSTVAVSVVVPRTTATLVATLGRARRGPSQQGIDHGRSTARSLLHTVRGPVSFWDALVFAVLTVSARRRARDTGSTQWERDDSSRIDETNLRSLHGT
ncbi:glycosyltransferase family 2 protein (plasmid) [Coraliomargarita sp. W4R53]